MDITAKVVATFDNFERTDFEDGSHLVRLLFWSDGSVTWDYQPNPYKE